MKQKQKKQFNGCSDDLEFEDEYLNEKRNGKGKEYHNNGELRFEGEYLNGKRSEKGKEYDYKGVLLWENI
jgi:antitoxin component YwqK of YwqJK toxin-antitoxin module